MQQSPTTQLDPDAPLSAVLDPAWAHISTLASLLPSWRELMSALPELGSPQWWEEIVRVFPATLTISACARREPLLDSLASIPLGSRVLDFGCGPGVTTRYLIEAGAAEAVGVDLGAAMIAVAEAGPAIDGVEFLRADATARLPFADNSFDAAVLGDFYHDGAVAEALRVVRPGGLITARMTDVVPSSHYHHDPILDLEVALAYRRGAIARAGGAPAPWLGRTRGDGFDYPRTIPFVSAGPLSPLGAAWALAADMLWRLGNAAGHLEPSSLARARELWHPDNPEALPYRSETYLVQHLSVVEQIVA